MPVFNGLNEMGQYIFFILAFISIISALLVVFSRNPIHSVLYLIVCFFTIAGHYVLLNAQFLAVVHIIVYAGAIMVLFLFVIMLLNLNKNTEPQKSVPLKFAAVVSACLLGLVVLASVKDVALMHTVDPNAQDIGLVKNVGRVLFNEYLLPFEVTSLLFLSAMIGVVLISKKES